MAISAAQASAIEVLVNVAIPVRAWSESNGDRLRGMPWRDPGGGILEKGNANALSAQYLNIAGLLDSLLLIDADGPALKPIWRALEVAAPARRVTGATAPVEGFMASRFGIAASANVAATWLVHEGCDEIQVSSDRVELYAHGLSALSAAYLARGKDLPAAAWVDALMANDDNTSGWAVPKINDHARELILSSEHFCAQLLRDVLIVLISQRVSHTSAHVLDPFAVALETGDSRRPGNAFSDSQTLRFTESFTSNAKKL
jgi:hypothetical protein